MSETEVKTKETSESPVVAKEAVPDVTKEAVTKEASPVVTKEASPDVTKEASPDVTEEASPDVTKEAYSLLAQAKRDMVCGEVPGAVQQLQQACRLLAKKFGETADECGEAYFCYGKALLDMARMESGVLGNALEGIDDEDEKSEAKSDEDKAAAGEKSSDERIEKDEITEEQKEKISDEVIDAMLETDEEVKAREKTGKDEGKAESTEDSKMDTEKGEDKKDEDKKDEEKKEKEQEKGEKDAEKKDAEKKGDGEEKMEEDCTEKNKTKDMESSAKDGAMEIEKIDEKKESSDEKKTEDKDADMETDDAEKKEEEDGEDIEDEDGEESQESQEEEGKEGTSEDTKDGESKEKEEEDISNLQLAWEMLELAKVIYKRQDSKEMKLKVAESHLKLGEVGLETEQYEQAVGDFKQCLTIQKEVLEPENRCLAETQYQLGLAFTYHGQFDDAISSYKSAASVIEAKIAKLQVVVDENSGKGKEPADEEDPVVKAQKEIKELKEILPDIMSKMDDVEDEKKTTDTVKAMVKENLAAEVGSKPEIGISSEAPSKEGEAKPTDITHLVRKKRERDDEPEDVQKKAKTEEGSGDAVTVTNGINGHTNGE